MGVLRTDAICFQNILSEIKTQTMYRLIQDKDLMKLLHYPTADALSLPMNQQIIKQIILQKETNESRRIFLKPYINKVTALKTAEIRIHFSEIEIDDALRKVTPILEVDVYCHNDITDLDDGISQRFDLMMEKVCDAINGYHVGTNGYAKLADIQDWSMNDTEYVGYTIFFEIGEINL